MKKCPLCDMNMQKIENTILEETNYFYVTPSVGSICEGYVLITAKRHINSMADLNEKEYEEYQYLIDKYREVFKSIYKRNPIVFEHGTPNTLDNVKASSVIHAHTHIVNHNYKNEKEMLLNMRFKRIDNLKEITSDKNYIMYIDPTKKIYVTTQFKPVSQVMRIEIAKDLNLSHRFDWRYNKFENNIRLTINKMRDYFNTKE